MTNVDIVTKRLQARARRLIGDWALRYPLTRCVCADGFNISIQTGSCHYSTPRDYDGPWSAFELGYPSAVDPIIAEYAEEPEAPTNTVYGYVPADVVEALLAAHGGLLTKREESAR